jgi:hypothetical protein
MVIVKFPSVKAAKDWIYSEAYQNVARHLGGQVGYMPSFKSGRSTSRRSIGPRSGVLIARTFYL